MNRVTKMTERYFDGKVPEVNERDEGFIKKMELMWENYHKLIEKFDIKKAAEEVLARIDDANKYIEDKKPWVLAKEDEKALGDVLYHLLEALRHVGYALYPFMPETAEKILSAFGKKPLNEEFSLNEKWGTLKSGDKINECDQLFPRLDTTPQ